MQILGNTIIFSRENIHRWLFVGALYTFALGIPFCRPLMSIAGIVLVANWFLEGRYIEKLKILRHNYMIWICLIIFFVHVIWLLNTENFSFAGKDIWQKIPLFFTPIIFGTTKPLSKKEANSVLCFYILGILVSSISGYLAYILNDALQDKREVALFISYIRFGMNVCFGIFVVLYLAVKNRKYLISCILIASWFLYILLFTGSITAILLLIVACVSLVIKNAFSFKDIIHRKVIPMLFLVVLLIVGVYLGVNIKKYYTVDFDISTADKYTAENNLYQHDMENSLIENGNYIYVYLCEDELIEAWQVRSDLDYYGFDKTNKHKIKPTLIRYLNSKGLRKDKAGVEALTEKDIENIENGIANVEYTHSIAIKPRLYGLLWEVDEYKKNDAVLSYSFPQRLELWRASIGLISQNPIFGVGTGDVKDAFFKYLNDADSPMKINKKRSHNQYFTFLIAFGFLGFMLILFSIFYPPLKTKKIMNSLFFVFMLIFLLSMISDDTLERQDGITFFAFFYSFFLFLMPKEKETKSIDLG